MADTKKLAKFIAQIVKPLKDRVMLMVARGVLEAIDDSTGIQRAKFQMLAEENLDNMERFQNYGFTSNPFPEAEGVVVFPAGNREHGLVIAIDDRRFRLKGLAKGEVALYTDEGDKIHFKRDGLIQIFSSNIELGKGSLEKILDGETFQAFFNTHAHLGNLGVPTGPPTVLSPASHLSSVVKAET